MLIAMSAGPLLKWRKDSAASVAARLKLVGAVAAIVFTGVAIALRAPLSAFGMAIAAWLVMAGPLFSFSASNWAAFHCEIRPNSLSIFRAQRSALFSGTPRWAFASPASSP
ncbi:MAG: hypothetical protein R3C60_11500 [Parvularculaceae bacterium]